VPYSLSENGIRGIVLDVEGTTTPIPFVYDVLFPYVRHELVEFLGSHIDTPEIQEVVRALKHEHEDDKNQGQDPPPWLDEPEALRPQVEAYVHWLMDHDRKSTALKHLQGRIWQEGYQREKLRGQVFADVPPAFRRWREQNIEIRIYSSGSELAQRLLFGSTEAGDLTKYLSGYFDTRIGGKLDDRSYTHIVEACSVAPEQLAFISDITRELDAARRAGLKTLLCRRPGNPPQLIRYHHVISSFDEVTD
jgi:enolase-phosphatase E1